MFDIGFTEMVLIGVIALVVLGPERLPVVARKLGSIVGYSRRLFNKLQQDFMQETTQLEREVQERMLAVKETVRETEAEIEKLVNDKPTDESEE